MKAKRITAFVLALALIISCFAFGLSRAFAKTQEIKLDTEMSNTTDGFDDKNWYYFTPSQTGKYTFLSYNRILYAEAFLFVKSDKTYTQLAYSNESPNYEYYGQPNMYQFCLTYRLEAGKTYYYAAGWDSSRTSGTMTAKLIYEGSDEDIIDHIEAQSNAELAWYTDGSWEKDSSGEMYFNYNFSRILQNMIITIYYINGTSASTAIGEDTIDGYDIMFTQNQASSHWYPKEDAKYSGNIITVSILNKSTQYNVVINQDALFTVQGKVCDYINGDAVSGAVINVNGTNVATTDSSGRFSFVYSPGFYNAEISGNNIIPRSFEITVEVMAENNNHLENPIGVVVGDYVADGIINAKDYGYILKMLSGEKQKKEEEKFSKQILFKANKYPDIKI